MGRLSIKRSSTQITNVLSGTLPAQWAEDSVPTEMHRLGRTNVPRLMGKRDADFRF